MGENSPSPVVPPLGARGGSRKFNLFYLPDISDPAPSRAGVSSVSAVAGTPGMVFSTGLPDGMPDGYIFLAASRNSGLRGNPSGF